MQKLASFTDAVSWLRDYQDADLPSKIHDRATGDDGAPRLSAGFMHWLTRDEADPERSPWAFQTALVTVQEDCPRPHPIRAKGEPRCELCDDALWWSKTRSLYVRPFMAALERLSHVPPTSKDWPAPKELVLRLIASRYNVDAAADAIGHPVLGADHRATLEAVFLNATRKLVDRYSTGPVPRVGRRSEQQNDAEAAA